MRRSGSDEIGLSSSDSTSSFLNSASSATFRFALVDIRFDVRMSVCRFGSASARPFWIFVILLEPRYRQLNRSRRGKPTPSTVMAFAERSKLSNESPTTPRFSITGIPFSRNVRVRWPMQLFSCRALSARSGERRRMIFGMCCNQILVTHDTKQDHHQLCSTAILDLPSSMCSIG